jgi:hypothetical protein
MQGRGILLTGFGRSASEICTLMFRIGDALSHRGRERPTIRH